MKETRIPYSLPMARARRAGLKTMTRRVVKHRWPSLWQEPYYPTGRVRCDVEGMPGAWMEFRHRHQDEPAFTGSRASTLVFCPYGQPGDRLWVRETFCDDWKETRGVQYKADGGLDADMFDAGCKWRPSIHMPRWASRITLEITGVRVERLQDISEADARAEGVRHSYHLQGGRSARENFEHLWWTINGDGSWEANPYVWVVEFKVVK